MSRLQRPPPSVGAVQPRARVSLGLKIALVSVAVVVAVSAGLGFFAVWRPARDERAEREAQYRTLTKFIATTLVTDTRDVAAASLARLFESRMQFDLGYVVVVSANGKVEQARVNPPVLATIDGQVAELYARDPVAAFARLASGDIDRANQRSLSTRLTDRTGKAFADLTVGFSTRAMNEALARRTATTVAVFVAALALAVVASLLLGRALARPLRALTTAMGRVESGDLDQTVGVTSRDEVALLAHSFNTMIRALKERERLKGTLARYVSTDVAQRILTEASDLDLAGELRRVTVVFIDVRGFTALSERRGPQEVVAILNEYFPEIVEVIFKWGGTINKFLGDAVMAIYGAPKDIDDPELRAVRTAAEVQERIRRRNGERKAAGKPVLELGIGINTGFAIAGNIGSALRMEYTVIGDDVNLAQRLESNAKEGQVLVSQTTYDKVQRFVEVVARDPLMVKGRSLPVQVYEVLSVRNQGDPNGA